MESVMLCNSVNMEQMIMHRVNRGNDCKGFELCSYSYTAALKTVDLC